jgi:hypothetical protein
VLPIVGAVVATISGLMLLMFVAGRRRRESEPDLEVAGLAGAVAGPEPTLSDAPTQAVATARPTVVPYIDPAEADMPRWRRPSVKAARVGTPAAAAAAARRPARAFSAPPADDVERFVVRYDAVSLLTEPDEVFGRHVVELDAGDEVETVGQHAMWLQIRTPSGAVGWLPRMTVGPLTSGEEVETPGPAQAEPAVVAQAQPEPEESQLDSLLAAIVAERARAAEAQVAVAQAAQAAQVAEAGEVAADQAVATTTEAAPSNARRSRAKRRSGPSRSHRSRPAADPG